MVLDQTLTRRDIKRNNRLRIYNRLRDAGSFSCLDISRDLGLSLPTVGKNISDLEEAGLVRSSEEKKNTGGRSSKLYEVVADYRVAIGVNITNQHISAVAIDLQGTVVAHTRFRQAFARCDDYYKKLGAAVQTVVLEAGLQDDQILGVGLVIPGLLTKDGESTYYSRVLRLDTDMTCEEISAYIPYQTRFFHDASSAAYAESWYNHDETDFFYMMISDSICGAPILDAHPYRGMNFRSGEIGHVQLIRGGRQCYCGKRGCPDAYCNTKVLATVTKGDLALFFEELEKGEERVQTRWKEYLHYLVTAITAARMLFDCRIVIGGYLGQYIDTYMGEVEALMRKEDPFSGDVDYLSVCVCKTEACASGGALSLIDQFIQTI